MFDIGFAEILFIMVVALVVIGPERLPGVARQLGRWIGTAKRFVSNIKSDLEREFQTDELRRILTDQEKEIGELREMMRKTEADLRSEVEETSDALHDLEDRTKTAPATTEDDDRKEH